MKHSFSSIVCFLLDLLLRRQFLQMTSLPGGVTTHPKHLRPRKVAIPCRHGPCRLNGSHHRRILHNGSTCFFCRSDSAGRQCVKDGQSYTVGRSCRDPLEKSRTSAQRRLPDFQGLAQIQAVRLDRRMLRHGLMRRNRRKDSRKRNVYSGALSRLGYEADLCRLL